MTEYNAAATTYNNAIAYDGVMAFAVGPRWRQTGTGPFFGPRYQAFVPIAGLPALTHSDKYMAFLHECSVRSKKIGNPSYSGPWGVNLIAPLGCPHALKSPDPQVYTAGWPVNDDAGQAQAFPIGQDFDSAVAERATWVDPLNSNNAHFLSAPKPSAFNQLGYQEMGRNPAASVGDSHVFFVSRRNRRELNAIGYQVSAPDGNTRLPTNASNFQIFMNKDRLGNPMYERALWQDEVVAAALGEAPSTGRFPAGPPMADHPYGRKNYAWRCADWALTNEYAECGMFGYCNGAGVAVYDYIPRYEEFEKGHINHALIATFVNQSTGWAPPAFRSDGKCIFRDSETPEWYDGATNTLGTPGLGSQVLAPKEGWLVRLKASALRTIEGFIRDMPGDGRRDAITLLRAMNEYGIMAHDKFAGAWAHANNPGGYDAAYDLNLLDEALSYPGYAPPEHYMFSIRLQMDERMPVTHRNHPLYPARLNTIESDGTVTFANCDNVVGGGTGTCSVADIFAILGDYGHLSHTAFEYVDATTLMSDRTANPYSMECA